MTPVPFPWNPMRRHAVTASCRLACGVLLASLAAATVADDGDAATWDQLRAGGIVLFRHAYAPGVGDPDTMRLGDCSTQRNLDAAGREQSRRIGEGLRAQGVVVGKVLASQWCRTLDTAELAFPGRVTPAPAFNSFFQGRDNAPEQTAAAWALLLRWKGPGALVVVTHQVNISALTDTFPASGEGIVLRPMDLKIVGSVRP